MTLEELLDRAASACIDERESYLVVFTVGINGYVCRNEGSIHPSKALYQGTYRECQIWVERRGIAAAMLYMLNNAEGTYVSHPKLSANELLQLIAR